VAEQVRRLTRALMDGARELGFRAKTPAESVGPLVVLQARDAAALVAALQQDGIICSSRHDGLRLSFHVYNTLADVDHVLRALARHRDLLVSDERPAAVAQ